MLRNFVSTLWALVLMVSVAQAQFNFFDHMFNGNQQQQQHQQGSQNVPSDSGRYQNQWRQCKLMGHLSRIFPQAAIVY